MTGSVPYIWVPYLAMIIHIFFLTAALSAKKDKVTNAFILYLFLLLMWTAGSTLMRLQMPPSYEFWYQVSLLSLFANAFGIYNFVYRFIGYRLESERRVILLITVIMLVLTYFEIFLKIPEKVVTDAGETIFVYDADWKVLIPTLICVAIVAAAVKIIIKSYRKNNTEVFALAPAGVGIVILIIGNLLSVFPNNIFPWDTLSSIINAMLAFYCLTRRRKFKMTLLVSRKALMFITLVFAGLIGVHTISHLEEYIHENISIFQDCSVVVVSIIFTVLVFIIYAVLKRAIDALFLRNEQVSRQKIKDFSTAATKTLETDDILKSLSDVVGKELGVRKVYVCLRDTTSGRYKTTYSSNPLSVNTIEMTDETPYIKWLGEHEGCLIVSEFKRTVAYWSMWDNEKRVLSENDIRCIAPLKQDNNLFGVVMLGPKRNGARYGYDDITFLDSIRAITSIATSNATMYGEMRDRANLDFLTGLLNRRAFYEKLEEACHNCNNLSIALILINLDDFRLYNELYGSAEGDEFLKYFGNILKNSAGRAYSVGRYSGKEFGICMPNCNQLQALNMAENIRNQLLEKRESKGVALNNVTFSAGICTIPYSASNCKELLTNVNMCVYQAKREGKNKICSYCSENAVGVRNGEKLPVHEDRYGEYVSTIYALTAAIDAKDHYTFSHSSAVATYAALLAEKVGLSESHVKIVKEAGLLHDIGKIAIPESILSKPGKLTKEEYAIMQTHVEHSIDMIRHLPDLDYLIPAVIGHHEAYNGTGYPRGIAGESIPIAARCLTIADCFDAMTSKRSYKEAYSYEYAAAEIRAQAGRQFDPKLAEIFVGMIEDGTIYPNMPKV